MVFAACEAVIARAVPAEDIARGAAIHVANKLIDYELDDVRRWAIAIAAGGDEHRDLMALETLALRSLTFALLTIPVVPILENARNGRHPLFQVESMDWPEVRPDEAQVDMVPRP